MVRIRFPPAGSHVRTSTGLRGKFPHYRYYDMVESGYRLITEGLEVAHLRLIVGSSMGGMHAWMWGEMYPDLMDGIVPLGNHRVTVRHVDDDTSLAGCRAEPCHRGRAE